MNIKNNLTNKRQQIYNKIEKTLFVTPAEKFNVKQAIRERIDYLKRYLQETNGNTYVLGISGGVDSTAAGKLAQLAINELNEETGIEANFRFIAVRLPSHIQKDENEAQEAIQFIDPSLVSTVNIGEASNLIHNAVIFSGIPEISLDSFESDFAKGNVKARMRMIAQYEIAGLTNGRVIGTDHNAENLTGFYTMHGDGACDLTVLDGLNKRQVRLIAKELGAPERLWNKIPTADLEEKREQLSDEDALGVSYDQIDDFLEGKTLDIEIMNKLIDRFEATEFKRRMAVSFLNK